MDVAKRNITLGIVHEALWGAGSSLLLPATILNLALVDLGQSASMAGLLASLWVVGINLPQLFSALILPPRFSHPKDLARLHVFTLLGPLTMCLGFALSTPAWQTGRLVVLLVGACLFGLGIGIVCPHWVASIGRCIPADRRGRYFGASFFASGLCGTFMGWLGSLVVAKGGVAWGYTTCFAMAVPLLVASIFVLAYLKPILASPTAPPKDFVRESFRLLRARLTQPSPLRRGMVLVILMTLAATPGSLFTVYLREEAHLEATWFQLFSPALTLGGMFGAFILGWLVDHKGLRSAYTAAFVMWLVSLASVSLWTSKVFPTLAFVGSGFSNAAFTVINFVMILKLSGDKESSTQAGLFATLMAPWNFAAPLVAGGLASYAGYPWTFALAAASCVAALVLLLRRRHPCFA